jgi:predicted AlkP superfamily pyrophosphatase or phosphodiesterase
MNKLHIAVFVLLLTGIVQADQPATRPVEAVRHVLIISIDGLRPDLLLRGPAPTLRGVLDSSSYTFWARTVKEAYTLPSHVSMLTGVVPDRHGVTWNNYIEDAYPNVPTLFELAKKSGQTTAMIAAKMKFIALAKPGTLDWKFIADETKGDERSRDRDAGQNAVAILREHQPNVCFVHLAEVDVTGHASGWGSPEQAAALGRIDAIIATIVAAEKETNLADSTVTIITADHGGSGRDHGPDDPRAAHIPWIVFGPGIRRNYDLTRNKDLIVNTEDTFATTCYLLAIPLPSGLDGKPVIDIFDHTELLQPSGRKGN